MLLAGLAGGNKDQRPAGFPGQLFGFFFNGQSGLLHSLAKILDEHAAGIQVSLPHLGAVELAQRSPEPQTIKTRKNSLNARSLFLYKRVGSAAMDKSLFLHNVHLSRNGRRFQSFLRAIRLAVKA